MDHQVLGGKPKLFFLAKQPRAQLPLTLARISGWLEQLHQELRQRHMVCICFVLESKIWLTASSSLKNCRGSARSAPELLLASTRQIMIKLPGIAFRNRIQLVVVPPGMLMEVHRWQRGKAKFARLPTEDHVLAVPSRPSSATPCALAELHRLTSQHANSLESLALHDLADKALTRLESFYRYSSDRKALPRRLYLAACSETVPTWISAMSIGCQRMLACSLTAL